MRLIVVALCVFGATTIALGQATASASLGGTVVDKDGALVPGATVTITNKATGQSRTLETGESGQYKFDLLAAGRYEIKVTKTGFADASSDSVEVLVGQTNTLDVTMQPAGVTGSVTITTAETELVSKEKTDVGMNITPRDVQDLPLNGRDLGNLAYLAPGASPSIRMIRRNAASRSSVSMVRAAVTLTSPSTGSITKTTRLAGR